MAARDALNSWVRALQYKKELDNGTHRTLLSVINEVAETHGAASALIDDNEHLTYSSLVERAERYAGWALTQGIASGDIVCLLMPNCVDLVAMWLGITHVGCTAALINTSLTGDALAHSIRIAGAKHLIVAGSLLGPVSAIGGQLPVGSCLWVHGDNEGADVPRIDHYITRRGGRPSIPSARLPSRKDRALLIYTSGTTGASKAANVTHDRVLEWSVWFAGMMGAEPEDRLYNCLPMYHSTGGVVAIGAMLTRGGSVLIRPRFSASRFWDDVVGGGCTIFQYIGELCRYLTRTAPHPLENAHRLRLCCGNGLSGEVWDQFQGRFQIPRILEFYAATEGQVSLYNAEGKPGAIGRIPGFLTHRFPVELIRSDVDTGEPVRDAGGFCIRCAADEPGEAIGPIVAESSAPGHEFDGYTDPDASARKVLRDVFAPGDRWFRTGDLMRKDKAGYYYFVDRIGDTFRWKGENVSTADVGAVVAACRGVTDAVVYGAAIAGMEGRAGMAAITTDETFSFTVLKAHLSANLPSYARPLFVRLCRNLPMTGTFKLTKGPLLRDGLSPSVASDTVWFNDPRSQTFVEYDASLMHQVCGGTLRL
jgi:fatty-acyl-CoA synthase